MSIELEKLAMIGKQLATLREYRKLTQEQLAQKCGVSRVYIGQVESGDRNPTLGVIFKMCDALQCYVDINFTPIK
jgi:transcriptional regulator with XRE-family HTH domain